MINTLTNKNGILYKIIITILIIYTLFFCFNSIVSILFQYQIDYAEGTVLYQSIMLSNGKNIYNDISSFPFILSPYTPLYQIICAPFIKIFGISFSYGRVISLISALFIAFLIYKILIKITQNKSIALFSSFLFIASPYIYNWSRLFRIDMLSVCFGFCGLYYVFKYQDNKKLYLSIIFFLLALYTKQSNIVAPASAIIYLFILNKKKFVIYTTIFVISGLIILLIVNTLTNGNFSKHIFKYHLVTFSFPLIIKYFSYLFSRHFGTIILAIIYILYSYKKTKQLFTLFNLYFFISFLFIAITGRIGVSHNIFLEIIISSTLLTGLLINKLIIEKKDIRQFKLTLFLILILVQIIVFFHIPYISKETFRTPDTNEKKQKEKIYNYVKNSTGKIVSDDMGVVALSGKDIYYQSFEYNSLFQAGFFNQDNFLKFFKTKAYKLLILSQNVFEFNNQFFSKEVTQEIKNNYKIIDKIDADSGYFIYITK